MLGRGMKIARIYGIDIRLDLSWFLMSAIIVWSLTSVFRELLPDFEASQHALMAILTGFLFYVSLLAHELSHALVARRKNIQVDSMTLFIFGGVARIRSEPERPKDEFQISIAGPITSSFLGAVFFGISFLGGLLNQPVAGAIFGVLAIANGILAVFNLVPGFPLDGGRILRSAIWKVTGDIVKATKIASWAGRGVAALLIAGGIWRIFTTNQTFGGFWWILMGLFLNQAASAAYRQTLLRSATTQVRVSDIMTPDPLTIPGNTRLGEAVHDFFYAQGRQAFPVTGYGGEVEGMITLSMVQQVAPEYWSKMTVRQVMFQMGPALLASPEESVSAVLERMPDNPTGRFIVLSGGRLVGMLTGANLAGFLSSGLASGAERPT